VTTEQPNHANTSTVFDRASTIIPPTAIQ
jgi:hypothetical protein